MKQAALFAVVLALGILAGCSRSKVADPPQSTVAYRTKATLSTVKNIGDYGDYDVAIVIEDTSDPKSARVALRPRVTVRKGVETIIEAVLSASAGENKQRSIICTVLVDDSLGEPEARITVSVKKDGEVVWSDKQTVTMTK